MALKNFYTNLVVTLLTLASFSCVDIPNGVNESELNVVSQVRYVNLTQGTDTVAFYLKQTFDSTLSGKPTRTYPVAFVSHTRKDSAYNRDTVVQKYTDVNIDTTCQNGLCDTTTTKVFTMKISMIQVDTIIHHDSTNTWVITCHSNGKCDTSIVIVSDTTKRYPDSLITRTITRHITGKKDTSFNRNAINTSFKGQLVRVTAITCDSATSRCKTTTKTTGSIDSTLRYYTVTTFDSAINRYTVVAGDTSIVKVNTSYYKRYLVDYDSTLDIILDGSKIASLQFGQSTSYMNNNSGSRKVYLKTNAAHVDTLLVIKRDSTFTTIYDTVGYGTSSHDTTITKKKYQQYTVASQPFEYIIADSSAPTLPLPSLRKVSIFLVRDTASTFSDFKGNGRARYGFIQYLTGDERYTFAAAPSADSIKIRYVNASLNGGAKHIAFNGMFVYRKPGKPDTILAVSPCTKGAKVCYLDSSAIVFLSNIGYYSYPAGWDTARFSRSGTPLLVVGTETLGPSDGGHRYTYVIVDSAATFTIKRLTDD